MSDWGFISEESQKGKAYYEAEAQRASITRRTSIKWVAPHYSCSAAYKQRTTRRPQSMRSYGFSLGETYKTHYVGA